MQNRSIIGSIFEKKVGQNGYVRVSKSPRLRYSGEGRTIIDKIKNSNLDPKKIKILDDSDFLKYDIVNVETKEFWEVKKYQKSNITNWKLFSEPFFKIATKTQTKKIDKYDYNLFVDRFWDYNNKQNFFDTIIIKMTTNIAGIRIINEFIPINDLEFRFIVKESWKGYKRITLEFKLK
jgi:hypothetical protein